MPSDVLSKFLASGSVPILIGFGSMVYPDNVTELINIIKVYSYHGLFLSIYLSVYFRVPLLRPVVVGPLVN